VGGFGAWRRTGSRKSAVYLFIFICGGDKMNSSQRTEGQTGFHFSRQTACQRLLDLFQAHQGQEIPLPRILALHIAQYNARIRELRAAGHVIENRTAWDGPVKHSWFVYRGKR
jgi:hypothetical protein